MPRTVAWIIASALVFAPVAAVSGVLPVVVDDTAGERFWWADDPPRPAGSFDEAVFSAAEGAAAAWVSPRTADTSGPVSRVFRRADITPNNARSMAGLFGASHVLVGRVSVVAEHEVPWLGIRSATVELRATVLDVASGSTVASLILARTAHDTVDPAAVAGRALASAVLAVGGIAARPASETGGDMSGVAIIRSPDGALPFVALRGAIRDAHPGIVDVVEVWATEGRIALKVLLDAGVRFQEVAPALAALNGSVLDGARVTGAVAVGDTVELEVRAQAESDTAAP